MRTCRRGALAAACAALLALPLTACSDSIQVRHELTFEITGSAADVHEIVLDPPGEQIDNVEVARQVPLPWTASRTTGYGFARLRATGPGPIRCRIVVDGTVRASSTSDPDGTVECRTSVQD